MEGNAVELEPLPIQYGDYALWQQQWLQGEALEQQLAYWKQQLANATDTITIANRLSPTCCPKLSGCNPEVFRSILN